MNSRIAENYDKCILLSVIYSIRGTLASMVMLSVNIGILLGYILGTHLAYHIIPFVVLIGPLSYFILVLLFIRDSPMHLIRKGKLEAAKKSFMYYKNIKISDSSIEQTRAANEFDNMRLTLTKDDNMPDTLCLKDFCKWSICVSLASINFLFPQSRELLLRAMAWRR